MRFRVDPLVPNDQTRLGATKGKERERDSEREEHVGKTEDMLEAWLDPLEGQCESGGDEAIRRKLS